MSTPAYGLVADLKAKQDAAYDPELERSVCEWIANVIGEAQEGTAAEWLHDGQILCKLANAIEPGAVKKVNTNKMVFKQRENITYFQHFARNKGLAEISMFGTDDLFDEKNMGSVMKCLLIFGGVIQVVHPEIEHKLGEPVHSKIHNDKRALGPVTQTGGLAGAMEVQKLHAGKREVAGGAIGVRDAADLGGSGPDAAGLDRDLEEKINAKYDPVLDAEACAWIEAITGEAKGSQSTHEWLHNGQVLCRLVNKLQPDKIKINTKIGAFNQRENITFFQKAMRDFGVPEGSLFGTDDLYEGKGMSTFITALFAFGGALQTRSEFESFPKLGAAVTHDGSGDVRRDGMTATDQTEAMQRAMQVDRPHNTGITAGADAGAR